MKKKLTKDQAKILGPIWQKKQESDAQFIAALTLLDVPVGTFAGGDLSGDEPYLLIREADVELVSQPTEDA